jgi:SH3 domain protein
MAIKENTVKTFSLMLISLLVSSSLYAEEVRYIRDTLYVPLRSGQSFQHRIVHKGLTSGTRLTLIETNEDGTYSKVKTNNGLEGWLQSQYLMDTPAAKNQLKTTQQQLIKLQASNKQLKTELNKLKQAKKSVEGELSKVSSNNSGLSKELVEIKNLSSRSIELNRDNNRLLQENEVLKNELDVIKADNQRLNDKADNDAFMNGAFAVLIGVMITLLIPRLAPKKRTDWA